jgi:lauroyl/myristoyl acyltransferase
MAERWLARRPVRPPYLSRGVWPLLLLADRLPYPWGEDLVARLFVAKAFVQGRPLRRALAWAACHRARSRDRWRLALACCAYQGRFVARHALGGVRHPDLCRRQVVLERAEHIAAAGGPTIFLAFHLGPPDTAVALRLLGHSLTWVGGANSSRASISEAWRAYHEPGEMLALSTRRDDWGGVLYQARRILLDGGAVCISADGDAGRVAFSIPVRGGQLFVRSGWLALRRETGARVLPVLSHMDGRTHVVTAHPPLPRLRRHRDDDVDACRAALAPLVQAHVDRHPEQCYSLVWRPLADEMLARWVGEPAVAGRAGSIG